MVTKIKAGSQFITKTIYDKVLPDYHSDYESAIFLQCFNFSVSPLTDDEVSKCGSVDPLYVLRNSYVMKKCFVMLKCLT